jgi:hypothetical protein
MPPKASLAWIWTLVIMALCWTPRFLLGGIEAEHRPPPIPYLDKAVHLGIFAVFAFLWMWAGSPGRRVWQVAAAGSGLALLTELGQELPIVSRDANLADGLADLVGVVVGLLAFELARRMAERQAVRASA